MENHTRSDWIGSGFERYELAAELKDRYRQATNRERSEVLDAFCQASGYQPKHH